MSKTFKYNVIKIYSEKYIDQTTLSSIITEDSLPLGGARKNSSGEPLK